MANAKEIMLAFINTQALISDMVLSTLDLEGLFDRAQQFLLGGKTLNFK